MDVVWHDHRNMQFITNPVIVATASKHDVPGNRRQDPSQPCHKGDEVWGEILLQVWKVAAVELHGPIVARNPRPQTSINFKNRGDNPITGFS